MCVTGDVSSVTCAVMVERTDITKIDAKTFLTDGNVSSQRFSMQGRTARGDVGLCSSFVQSRDQTILHPAVLEYEILEAYHFSS